MTFGNRRLFRAEGAGGGSAGAGTGTGTGDGKTGESGAGGGGSAFAFDTFTKGLDEATRTGLTTHIEASEKGLKSALATEREQRSAFEKQLGELKAKAEKGSELEKQLETMQSNLKESGLQTAFYESAVGAGCTDIKLAWAAAKMDVDKFFKRDNTPDMEALKAAHPSLFAEVKTAKGNAGTGTGGSGGSGAGGNNPNQAVNDAIRGAAGFRTA